MKNLIYLILGLAFGFVLFTSEVISWYRIQEMFRFHNFHMYGVIGSAVVLGIIFNLLLKAKSFKTLDQSIWQNPLKPKGWNNLIGGLIFGLGWALVGACPGPIYTLIGAGYFSFIIVLLAAIFGAFLSGFVRK
ncbi:MAG: YeeE/YedE family protein [Flavobacteriales bacterium]|nr:YeeE/YedE family protein [Flavobacteriales bacterium]